MDRLFVCCYGQPIGHYCWGHICNELEARNRLAGAVDTSEYDIPAVVRRASKYYFNRAHFDFKGSIHRKARSLSSLRAARKSGSSVVLHITTLDMPAVRVDPGVDHYLLIDSTWNSWKRHLETMDAYPKRLERSIEAMDLRSFQQAKHIFTLGSHVCDDLVSHYGISPLKCTAIGTGPGGLKPYFGPKNYASRSLLFVAKTRFESKGGVLLVEAFKLLAARDPSVRLTIVGSDEAALFAAGMPNIEVKSYIPFDELQELFNHTPLFVLPALNEPWGMVYLEAMACRSPIVGLERGSLPELTAAGTLGFLTEPNPIAIADAIIDALSDPARLERMGQACQSRILGHYTWDQAVSRMLDVIDAMA